VSQHATMSPVNAADRLAIRELVEAYARSGVCGSEPIRGYYALRRTEYNLYPDG
jgi:hypothetical protein